MQHGEKDVDMLGVKVVVVAQLFSPPLKSRPHGGIEICILLGRLRGVDLTREMCSRIDMHAHVAPRPGPSQSQRLKPFLEG